MTKEAYFEVKNPSAELRGMPSLSASPRQAGDFTKAINAIINDVTSAAIYEQQRFRIDNISKSKKNNRVSSFMIPLKKRYERQ